MKRTLTLLALTANISLAATTALSGNAYQVDEGVAFMLGNDGASDYLYSWTDASGSQLEIADPTLILSVGETYTFQRSTSAHPFAILNDTLAVSEISGSLFRDSTDSTVINAAILSPNENFTANPPPVATTITWTPGSADVGNYFYTCLVTGHTGMTGRIQVVPVPEPSSQLLLILGLSFLSTRRKR